MFDFILNTISEAQSINWWNIATPIITAGATFGAVYFGAWLTDKRRKEEQYKEDINKAKLLHTLIELQLPMLIDYRDETIIPKLNAIKKSNLSIATEKYPFSSWLIPIDIKDYLFLINTSKGAMSALNQVIKYEEQLNDTIHVFNNFSLTEDEKTAPNCIEIHMLKIKCIIETLYETCDSLIFFSLILHRYLSYLLVDIFKEKEIYFSDALMAIDIKQAAGNDKIKLGWLKMLSENWQSSKYPIEINIK